MPLTADDRLFRVRVKVERAKQHLRHLAGDILAAEYTNVVSSDKYAALGQKGGHSFSAGPSDGPITVPQFSVDVLTGIGDIAHNLRSALDHLACQLVIVTGHKVTNKVCFPIAEDVTRYESRKAGIVECVGPGVIEAMDRLKPYKGGNLDLWRIHELDRIDKHRNLFTLAHPVSLTADWLPDGSFLFKKDAPDYAGLFDEKVEQYLQFKFEESIGQSEVSGGDAILPTLHHLVDAVESIVLGFRQFLEPPVA